MIKSYVLDLSSQFSLYVYLLEMDRYHANPKRRKYESIKSTSQLVRRRREFFYCRVKALLSDKVTQGMNRHADEDTLHANKDCFEAEGTKRRGDMRVIWGKCTYSQRHLQEKMTGNSFLSVPCLLVATQE